MLEKYKLSVQDKEEFNKKCREIEGKWRELMNKLYDKKIAENKEFEIKKEEQERLRKIKQEKWEAKMKPFYDMFDKIFNSIIDTFTYKVDIKNIIKRTKQTVGFLITIFLLFCTYFIVNALSYVLLFITDTFIEYWFVFAVLGSVAAAIGILYLMWIFVNGWLTTVINKYKNGKKVWYIQPFIYGIFYPLKYIVLSIFYTLMYILWVPIKYIFKLILKPIGLFIWKIFSKLWNNIVSSTGIFGEYFGASYSAYCPGIEWTDVNEDDI